MADEEISSAKPFPNGTTQGSMPISQQTKAEPAEQQSLLNNDSPWTQSLQENTHPVV